MLSSNADIEIRFDNGNLLLGAPVKTAEGFLRAKATFARDGVLEYIKADGTIHRELRTPQENQRIYQQYGLRPLTLEHPPQLLTPVTAPKYATGSTDGTTAYDLQGFIHGEILSFDDKQIRLLESGEALDISSGYTCKNRQEPGTWRGEPYDSVQIVKDINHVCTTRRGRSGNSVGVKMDSEFSDRYRDQYGANFAMQINNDGWLPPGIEYVPQTQYFDLGGSMSDKQLVSTQIGKTTYQVDPLVAPAIENQANRIDSLEEENKQLKAQLAEAETKADSLQTELEAKSSEVDELTGRCDTFETFIDQAQPALQSQGYRWDAASATLEEPHSDMKDKHHQDMDDHEDMDDEDMEYGDEGTKNKKDMSGQDQGKGNKADCKQDSATELVAAYEDAKTLIPDLKFDGEKYDSVVAIQRDVVSRSDFSR